MRGTDNPGFARHRAAARRDRLKQRARLDARMNLQGIPADKLASVRNAYVAYLSASRDGPAMPGWREAPQMPSGVTEGPAVDWSGYDLANDYA